MFTVFGNSFNLAASLAGGVVSLLTSYLLYRQNCKLDLQNSEYEKEVKKKNLFQGTNHFLRKRQDLDTIIKKVIYTKGVRKKV